MASKSRLTSADITSPHWPVTGSFCQVRTQFFREEFAKHHRYLEESREYFSDVAIAQAEDALARVMAQIEQLSLRDDAGEVVGELLRRFDLVTRLSAWTGAETLH